MNFVNFNSEGKFVIQNPALILSGLENEPKLEMHTLDGAIILIKPERSFLDQLKLRSGLNNFVSYLTSEVDKVCTKHEEADRDNSDINSDGIRIPFEMFENAGILGENLCLRCIEGAVIITSEKMAEDTLDKIADGVVRAPYNIAVLVALLNKVVNAGDTDD